jgi:glycosyltransferase involved in cell wall biosynthesis
LLSTPLPYYDEIILNIPPLLDVLEYADRQQFDAVHVSTPGPMGLCGWLVSKMLRVPLVCTYHTDFPAYVDKLARDHRVTNGTTAYMKWFYRQAAAVFSRSSSYRFKLLDLGVAEDNILQIPPAVDTTKFSPVRRDDSIWSKLKITQPHRLLYAGRISVEKNLPLLADAFRRFCEMRRDAALILAGDGPYREAMQKALGHLPVHFLGTQSDDQLAVLYASADLFVFPSRTDTLGQVVMEAQASGLPAIVSPDGGPKESIEDNRTGVIIDAADPARWAATISELLNDAPRRHRMSQLAAQRTARQSLSTTFEAFWNAHLHVCQQASLDESQKTTPGYNAENHSLPARSS